MNRFRSLLRLLAALTLLVGLLAACGNDDNGNDDDGPDVEAPAETETDPTGENGDDTGDEPAPEDADAAPSGGSGAAGTVIVDGVEYAMDESIRCEPDDGVEMLDRDLDLQFIGSGPDGRVIVHFYSGEIGSNPHQDVAYNGPEGVYGAFFSSFGGDEWFGEGDDTYDSAPFVVEGNRITGGGQLADSLTMEPGVSIELDVTFGDQMISC